MVVKQCLRCKHFWGMSACDAYPEKYKIPKEILSGEHDHTIPYKNDNGITFEPTNPVKDTPQNSRG